jgi:hypothetical protein
MRGRRILLRLPAPGWQELASPAYPRLIRACDVGYGLIDDITIGLQRNEGAEMNRTKIAAVGALALALTGLGVGGAVAATPVPPTTATTAPAPDPTATNGTAPGTTEAPDATEAPGAPETPGASDGNDGGHADPDGVDVNNEGGAAEK